MMSAAQKPKFPKDPNKHYADGLYARVSLDGKFYWAPVEIKRQNLVPVDNATSYIYRKMINGKRPVVKLGKDLGVAFTTWRNLESDAERVRRGRAPLHTEENTTVKSRLSINDAVEAYIASNADKVLKLKRRPRSTEAYNKAVMDFVTPSASGTSTRSLQRSCSITRRGCTKT